MSTKRVTIKGQEAELEALLGQEGTRGVVICHPHLLYGGSMYSNVVEAMEEGFRGVGLTTLRFNFRGVGRSTGRYAEGEGEVRDIVAAHAFLADLLGPQGSVFLAGYSFGAWTAARAADEAGSDTLFLVAYPASYDDGPLRLFRGRLCLVLGDHDEIGRPDRLLEVYRELKCEKYLKIVSSDHFFAGREAEIVSFIEEVFGSR